MPHPQTDGPWAVFRVAPSRYFRLARPNRPCARYSLALRVLAGTAEFLKAVAGALKGGTKIPRPALERLTLAELRQVAGMVGVSAQGMKPHLVTRLLAYRDNPEKAAKKATKSEAAAAAATATAAAPGAGATSVERGTASVRRTHGNLRGTLIRASGSRARWPPTELSTVQMRRLVGWSKRYACAEHSARRRARPRR